MVITRHLTAPPPRLADSRPDLADLDAALSRAMAKNPAERFGTCLDFASALRGQRIEPVRPPATPLAPTMHAPVTPPPQPVPPATSSSRSGPGPLILLVGALAALLTAALVVVGILLFRNGNQQNSAQPQSTTPSLTLLQPTVTVPSTVTVAPTPNLTAAPSATMVLPDADQHGFVAFNGGGRCNGDDNATMLLRTAQSAIAICQDATGANYYVGLRLSDDAPIELTNVAVAGGQATAVNPSDLTQYQVSRTGLQIVQNGQIVASEPALEFAS